MSRRSGQNGCIQEDGNWYVVRFWKGVAGQEKRRRIRERICPISGPGKLSASERKHKAKEIIEASGADSVEHFEKVVRSNRGITFRERAEIWLEPVVADKLREFVGEGKSGLLFSTQAGRQISQSNILRRSLHPILAELNQPKMGCHAFRRFRVTWLRKNLVPEDLIKFWHGHAGNTVTDSYSKLKDDVEFRKQVVEKVGLGFEILSENPVIGPNGPKIEVGVAEEVAVNC